MSLGSGQDFCPQSASLGFELRMSCLQSCELEVLPAGSAGSSMRVQQTAAKPNTALLCLTESVAILWLTPDVDPWNLSKTTESQALGPRVSMAWCLGFGSPGWEPRSADSQLGSWVLQNIRDHGCSKPVFQIQKSSCPMETALTFSCELQNTEHQVM